MMFDNPTDTYKHSRQVFEDTMSTMRENYYILGGLHWYLVKEKAETRKTEITPDSISGKRPGAPFLPKSSRFVPQRRNSAVERARLARDAEHGEFPWRRAPAWTRTK